MTEATLFLIIITVDERNTVQNLMYFVYLTKLPLYLFFISNTVNTVHVYEIKEDRHKKNTNESISNLSKNMFAKTKWVKGKNKS